MVNDQDFPKLTEGTRQRGGLDNVEYGNSGERVSIPSFNIIYFKMLKLSSIL